ncbi:MAG: hypothetical protein C4520_20815 [Candidatus Abyssobacteria bacterium SURF_5]|uniref:Uncharacterized protein n=1 Tax=Abyssobacteria bacterium (strain SURF_5) TaxID=2093360 RepID=A0A3A4NI93_ABYX5|nr:MAG: hypothetical protein C4520_20815 [Candidatus Abyssubacteria bacterium SURF_5]
MHRQIFTVVASVLLVFIYPALGWAGFCLDSNLYCQDYYLNVTPLEGGLYELHGYEYGCGEKAITLSGTAIVYGEYVYICFNLASGVTGGDYGSAQTFSVVMDLSTMEGFGLWNAFYLISGEVFGSGGIDENVLRPCANPEAGLLVTEPSKLEYR